MTPGFAPTTAGQKQVTITDGSTGRAIRRSIDGDEDKLGRQKDAAERRLQQALLQFWGEQRERVQRKLEPGIPKSRKAIEDLPKRLDKRFWDAEDKELLAVLMPLLSEMGEEAAEAFVDEILAEYGIAVDWTQVNTEAAKWARGYGFDLVKGINRTTKNQLQRHVGTWVETPGATMGDLFKKLATLPAFNEKRAQLVGVTEVTRAYQAGNKISARAYESEGYFQFIQRWNSNLDDAVCPLCRPLHDTEVIGEDAEFPDGAGEGPPRHPGCRCWVTRTPAIAEAAGEGEEQAISPTMPTEYQVFEDIDQAREWMAQNFADWEQTIAREERAIFRDYVRAIDEDYYKLNAYLRGQLATEEARAIADRFTSTMDAAIARGRIDGNVSLWRGANQTGLFADPAALVGQVIQDGGYVSTTVTASKAGGWARAAERAGEEPLLCEIRTPQGTTGAYLENIIVDQEGQRTREYETILPRDTKFRVISYRATQTFEFLAPAEERYPLIILEVVE